MKKKSFVSLLMGFGCLQLSAQIDAGLFRFPDVSQSQIVFTYANDVWIAPKEGGTAIKLSSPAGVESFPKFSPDGKTIAFSGNYDGNLDVYSMPANGGVPLRLTQHGLPDRIVDWAPDGKRILFASGREAGRERFNQFFTISSTGGAAERMQLAYAEFGSYSPDGKQMAVTFRSTVFRTWKRYQGGLSADIHIFNLKDNSSENISTKTDFADELPMWHGNHIYFITDRGPEVRMNLWRYDVNKKTFEQLTKYTEYDFVKNLTRSSGYAERNPAWSPDGTTLAYWSDQSGEYELWTMDPSKENSAKKLTNYGPGFRYNLFWSPDSKKIAFIDKAMRIKVYDFSTSQTYDVDKGLRMSHGQLEGFRCDWSPDSRWLTYSRDLENYHTAIFIYDMQSKKTQLATSGYYNCSSPAFDADGKYLFLLTNQNFQPSYSSIDNTFIYPNSGQPAFISLKKSTPSLLSPKNDKVEIKVSEENVDTAKKKDAAPVAATPKPKVSPVEIDFDGFESRLTILPVKPGVYGNINSVKGKIIYQTFPNTGAADGKTAIKYFDIEKREEKTIIEEANRYLLAADGKKILALRGNTNTWAVIKPEENQKFEKPLRINEMTMTVNPVQEWKQLFMDTWRLERDFFYDAGMHGVDWNLVKERYLKMLDGATCREEVNFVLGEMIGELNSSHTYRSGGDEEQAKSDPVGYLGVNWAAEGNYYKIDKIIRTAAWDAEVRSPLDRPGVDVKEGSYILAVNGIPLTTEQEPFAAFQGLANKAVEITYNSKPSWDGAKTVVVQTMSDGARLRNLAWIESNRKRVEESSNGDIGYIYVPSTGVVGQNELMRQFNAQCV